MAEIICNNIEVHFIELTLKGLEMELYYNVVGKNINYKMMYSNVPFRNPKKNERYKVKVQNDNLDFVILVESNEKGIKKYIVYLRSDICIPNISLPIDRNITKEFLKVINYYIDEENKYMTNLEKYNKLPNRVKRCIPSEDIEFFNLAISENTWYRYQYDRIMALTYVLGCKLVKNWLVNIDVYSISKEQSDLDSLAIYVAFKLTKCLPDLERSMIIEKLKNYIPKGEEQYYLEYF